MTKLLNKSNKTRQKLKSFTAETIVAIYSSPTLTQAAQKLGITRGTLYDRMNSEPAIKRAIEDMKEIALKNLQQASQKAADTMIEKLDDPRDGLEASKEILNRVGIGGNNGPVIANQINFGEEMRVDFIKNDPVKVIEGQS